MTKYTQVLTDAGMKPVDAYRLGHTIACYVEEGRKETLAKVFDTAFKEHERNGPLALAIVRMEEQAENDRRHLMATRLVDAVQSEDVARLQQEVDRVAKIAQDENRAMDKTRGVPCRGYIDAELTHSGGLTALHVACGNYKLHPAKREVFDAMAGILLAAGANALKPVGEQVAQVFIMGKATTKIVDPGRTIAEVCRGEVPPSMTQWLATRTMFERIVPVPMRSNDLDEVENEFEAVA